MIINNKSIREFGANLLSRYIHPTRISYNLLTPDDSLVNVVGKRRYGQKQLQVSIEFYGSRAQIELNKSMLMQEILNEPVVQFDNIQNKKYIGYVDTIMILDQHYMFEVLEFSMQVHEESHEIENRFDSNIDIHLSSTMETPAIIEITPLADIGSVKVDGFDEDIIIRNLKKGVPVIIDGKRMLVTEEGVNKFKDYDSWIFPSLKIGMNNIKVSGNTSNRIIYSPRWL